MKQIVISRDWFEQWLVGITDGDGCFGIYHQNGKWNLSYKITQSRYNLRLLYFIKKQLGVGSITRDINKGQFFIRDRKKFEKILFPIFDKYPLLTSKQFNYLKLKQAFTILHDDTITRDEKNKKLFALKDCLLPDNYISPVWKNNLSTVKTNNTAIILSKPWLIGFVEAEGSFYLVNKDSVRIVHGFAITQKLDKIVLEQIKSTLRISSKIKYNKSYYMLDTTNSRAIENIIKYFENTMKGMKSVEFRIWARSYKKNKGNSSKLIEVRNIIRNMRHKLLDISEFDKYNY